MSHLMIPLYFCLGSGFASYFANELFSPPTPENRLIAVGVYFVVVFIWPACLLYRVGEKLAEITKATA